MSTLLLRLAGPIQTYAGYRLLPNSYTIPTAPLPSKSGVAGLLGAALGRRDLDALRRTFDMHVRVDRTNAAEEDLQVMVQLPGHLHDAIDRAEKFRNADPRAHGQHKTRKGVLDPKGRPATSLVNRDFIPHAEFIVAVRAHESSTTAAWSSALRRPRFLVYLGRRANPPTFPFVLGSTELEPGEVLAALPTVPRSNDAGDPMLRVYEVAGSYDGHEHRLLRHVTPERVDREEQLTWLSAHLSR